MRRATELSAQEVGHDSARTAIWVRLDGTSAWLCYGGSLGVGPPGFDSVESYMVRILITMIQIATGASWQPQEVHLPGLVDLAPGVHVELRGARVKCNKGVTGIHFPRQLLAAPLLTSERGRVDCPASITLPTTGRCNCR